MQPTTLIIRTAGTNCDRELVHAFEQAGAKTVTMHIHRLIEEPQAIEQADLIGFPGGFSYGDDIAAGRILANRLRHRLAGPLKAAVERGVPMIGICNGFQVLVKLGLLPFPEDMVQSKQSATLADNTSGRFIDRWVSLQAKGESVCIWTKGLENFDLPMAHGEGRFVPANEGVLARMKENRQIAICYAGEGEGAFGGNPNGSVEGIAGVCDPSGLVLGLMPHPERFVHETHHPHWTRKKREMSGVTAGLKFFENAVRYVKEKAAAETVGTASGG